MAVQTSDLERPAGDSWLKLLGTARQHQHNREIIHNPRFQWISRGTFRGTFDLKSPTVSALFGYLGFVADLTCAVKAYDLMTFSGSERSAAR